MIRRIALAPITAETTAAVKASCAAFGAKVRVRKLSGSLAGRVSVTLVSGTREQVRDGLVMLNAMHSMGTPCSSPDFRFCWNGDQINVCFPA